MILGFAPRRWAGMDVFSDRLVLHVSHLKNPEKVLRRSTRGCKSHVGKTKTKRIDGKWRERCNVRLMKEAKKRRRRRMAHERWVFDNPRGSLHRMTGGISQTTTDIGEGVLVCPQHTIHEMSGDCNVIQRHTAIVTALPSLGDPISNHRIESRRRDSALDKPPM